jgi:tetratricopeptide (TPR) repeat protein
MGVTVRAPRESASEVEHFLTELDRLRRARGLSLKELAKLTDIPTSTLHYRLTKGERLPSWDDVQKIVSACRADRAQWHAAWRQADAAAVPGRPAPGSVPAQLPADIVDFTGRTGLLTRIRRVIDDATSLRRCAAVPVIVLSGPPGVGKSALAVHAAHAMRVRFPDGQLAVCLHGGGQAEPRDPAEVLAEFLRAFGTVDAAVPRCVDERARQLRSQLAGKRVLVLLDDAAHTAQVRPLLPGTAGCAVLLTSRSTLADLDGAVHVNVGVFDPPDADSLLRALIGADRMASEPDAAREIVQLCGGLPLALRIIGARLATRPQRRLQPLAARLADERRRLDELRVADLEIRSGFLLSYHGLRAPMRDLFALLGLLPAVSFAPWTVAVLADISLAEAEEALETLADTHLVETLGYDAAGQARFRLHDLLWLFARERLAAQVPETERQTAAERLIERCLAIVGRLGAALAPGRPSLPGQEIDLTDGAAPWLATPEGQPDRWYESERAWLATAVRMAADRQMWDRSWQLAASLTELFDMASQWDEWDSTNLVGLRAAEQAGDHAAIGIMLRSTGRLSLERGDFADAHRNLKTALTHFPDTPDDYQRALTIAQLAETYESQGRYDLARQSFEQVLPALRRAGDQRATGWVLRGLGVIARMQGRLAEAETSFREAQEIFVRSADHFSLAYVTISLGKLNINRGALDDALHCFQRALRLFDRVGGRRATAMVLLSMGQTHQRRGSLAEAQDCFDRCLAITTEVNDRPGRAFALLGLGEVAAATEAPDRARRHLAECCGLFAELDLPGWEEKAAAALTVLAG